MPSLERFLRLTLPLLCAAGPALAQKSIDVDPNIEIAVRPGEPAPEFRLKTLGGSPVVLSELKGRPVIVNFWATWCPPCRVEMPMLATAQQTHQDAGLEVLAVNLTDQEYLKDVRKFAAELGIPFRVALDEKGRVRSRYGLVALPTTVFIGADGTVRVVHSGPITAAALDRHLALILPAKPQDPPPD